MLIPPQKKLYSLPHHPPTSSLREMQSNFLFRLPLAYENFLHAHPRQNETKMMDMVNLDGQS